MLNAIVQAASAHYRGGRPGDLQHVRWICRRLETLRPTLERRGYDFEVIAAVAVLHDVGYSSLEPGYDPFALPTRKKHQIESARIAQAILTKVQFPKAKLVKTVRIIRHHDDWALGEPLKDVEWRIFTDLDFSWEASPQGFEIVRRFLKQDRKEFLNTVKAHYRRKQRDNPFFLSEAKRLFLADLRRWEESLNDAE